MPASAGHPWFVAAGRVLVRVRVTPGASAEAVIGLEPTGFGPALKARVRAVPEHGKANAAVAALLARWLGVPPRAVEVASGTRSRVKTLAIAADPAVIEPRLALLTQELCRT